MATCQSFKHEHTPDVLMIKNVAIPKVIVNPGYDYPYALLGKGNPNTSKPKVNLVLLSLVYC